MRALFAAAVALAAVAPAGAQHATAFDVEDGKRVYQASCANCHGPDGNLIANIDFGRGVYRRQFSNDALADLIVAGLPNTPMPPNFRNEPRAGAASRRIPALDERGPRHGCDGDAGRGRAVFEGKGECLDCHRVNGVGSRVGPDLTAIGQLRRAGEIERSLLEPEAEVQPENRFYKVTPKNGDAVAGRLLNRDTFTVQLLDLDERLRSFRVTDLREQGFTDTPMPSARDELSPQEIADVVSFLSSLRGGVVP